MPKVEIVDERGRPLQDKFYKEGSIIELRCVVSEVPQPARQVSWKHGGRLLNYDTKRGGVRLVLALSPAHRISLINHKLFLEQTLFSEGFAQGARREKNGFFE